MNPAVRQRIVRRHYNGNGPGHGKRSGPSWWLTLLLSLGALGAVGAAAGVGVVFAIYNSYAKDYVPIEDKLRQTNIGLTEIYDRGGVENGVHLGSLTNPDAQLLEPVKLDRISKNMINATVSTEDNSYYSHPGFNWRGITRAAWENYAPGGTGAGSGTGGSSITQQLVKNVYICPNIGDEKERCATAERTLDRKLRELAFAIELEKDYSKNEILEWYLNQISYADRYVGIQAAAQGYFRKDAADLTLGEAAMLAGIPAHPSRYHPRIAANCLKGADDSCVVDPEGRTTVTADAKARQEQVLELMVEHKRATRAEADAAKTEALKVYSQANPLLAAAFIDNQVEPRLVRMCDKGILPKLPSAANCVQSVHSAGYKVRTTLDQAETQVALEMIRGAVEQGVAAGCNCFNAAIATIEPTTGQLIVYAPNRDPSYTSDPKVAGNVDQLIEINQPGSSFKPAVYLAWFDKLGKAPMSTLWDTSPLKVEGTEITNPRRDGHTSQGMVSARAGLGGSQNVPAFRAAQEAGVDNVIQTAKRLGITTLDQRFDPTFRSHPDVTYGASIATGGANLRAIDMAYMNATIANMGVMVGVPHLAETRELRSLKSLALDTGEAYDEANSQKLAFQRGHLRIPGTRELDPVVILEVIDIKGSVVYRHTESELQKKQVIDAGSVWLLHSIMSDCNARFIIWGCGSSNNDLGLDFVFEGQRFPSGIKTGTQQGPKSASDTLATWMNGYTRYAATSVWVGNATRELVNDRSFAAANTTVRLFKNWMAEYHRYAKANGVFQTPRGFDDLRPRNVAQREIESPSTDRGLKGGCDQMVSSWVRTDVKLESECEEKEIDTRNGLLATDQTPPEYRKKEKFVKLPGFKPEAALELIEKIREGKEEYNIPVAPTDKSTGNVSLSIASPTNGSTAGGVFPVIGTVQPTKLKSWKLEIGEGAAPKTWNTVGSGEAAVTNGVLGTIDASKYKDGVYTIQLTAIDQAVSGLRITVTFNINQNAPGPRPTGSPGTFPAPRQTPTVAGTPVTPTATNRPAFGTPTPRPSVRP